MSEIKCFSFTVSCKLPVGMAPMHVHNHQGYISDKAVFSHHNNTPQQIGKILKIRQKLINLA